MPIVGRTSDRLDDEEPSRAAAPRRAACTREELLPHPKYGGPGKPVKLVEGKKLGPSGRSVQLRDELGELREEQRPAPSSGARSAERDREEIEKLRAENAALKQDAERRDRAESDRKAKAGAERKATEKPLPSTA